MITREFVLSCGVILLSLGAVVSGPSRIAVAQPLKAFTCEKQLSKSEAERALTTLQAKYAGLTNFEAVFLQDSYLAALDQSQQSNGTVKYVKPSKMRWDYESPESQVFLLDGNSVWYYQPKLEQVLISEVTDVLLSQVPVLFLGGLGDVKASFDPLGACSNVANREADGIILDLKPKNDSDNQLQKVRLLVDGETSLPRGGEVTDVGGNVTTILFSSMIINKKSFPMDGFTLKLPQGLDVQDTRNSKALPVESPSNKNNTIVEKDL